MIYFRPGIDLFVIGVRFRLDISGNGEYRLGLFGLDPFGLLCAKREGGECYGGEKNEFIFHFFLLFLTLV